MTNEERGAMTWWAAQRELRGGKAVRRTFWAAGYVFMAAGALMTSDSFGRHAEYTPSADDLVADNWITTDERPYRRDQSWSLT